MHCALALICVSRFTRHIEELRAKNFAFNIYWRFNVNFIVSSPSVSGLFVYSKLLVNGAKCDEKNIFHLKCDNAFKLLDGLSPFFRHHPARPDLYRKANKTEETKF